MRYWLFVPLATAAALVALYLSFVLTFVQSDLLQGATALELGIFGLQFAKIIAVFSVKSIRHAHFVNIVNILGAELVVLLPGLFIADVYFGVQNVPALVNQLFLAWIAGATVFGTPYAAYRLVRSMVRNESLVTVLPSTVFLSELLILLVAGANTAASSGSGLAGLVRAMMQVAVGTAPANIQGAGTTALVPLAVLFVSLLLYALTPGGDQRYARLRGLVGLALLATVVTWGGAYASSQFALSLIYFAVPPSLVTITLIWWATREV
jgi:hypothetical protein